MWKAQIIIKHVWWINNHCTALIQHYNLDSNNEFVKKILKHISVINQGMTPMSLFIFIEFQPITSTSDDCIQYHQTKTPITFSFR